MWFMILWKEAWLFCVLVCMNSTDSATIGFPAIELSALQSLFNSTQGVNWNWRPNGPRWVFTANANPCLPEPWQGLTCVVDNTQHLAHVQEIQLKAYNLNGTLPNSIGNFSDLTNLDLQRNEDLTGPIPASLAMLVKLTGLNLQECAFTGTIPSGLSQLTLLTNLLISDNILTGTLPPGLGSLHNLVSFAVALNSLQGSIPNSYGQMTSLQLLILSECGLTGTLPNSIGALPNLQYLYITVNRLTGTLPAWFGNATAGTSNLLLLETADNQLSGPLPAILDDPYSPLEVLSIEYNYFSGTLSDGMANLLGLEQLAMSNNLLSGTIPAGIASAPLLYEVFLYANRFTGTIPPAVSCAANLTYFQVGTNFLTGTLPASLAACTALIDLNVSGNSITGPIPASFDALVQLQSLDLSINHLTSTLPSEIGQITSLLELNVGNNLLSGVLPEAVFALPVLGKLLFNDNHLQGTLPTALANCSALVELQAQNNQLTGSLDAVFDPSVQTALSTVQLASNQLSGTLPAALFQLPALSTLVLAVNCFEGTLPMDVCSSQALNGLVLDGLSSATSCDNRVSAGLLHSYALRGTVHGAVPACLYTLPQLHTVHLSGNGFTGSVPSNMSTVLSDLSLSHNLLTGTIPDVVLQRGWLQLDLSYNRLSGGLSSGPVGPPVVGGNGMVGAFYLQNNRLSGRIPGSLQRRQNISILGTNMFSCRLDGSNLPEHDSDADGYQCASDGFNVPYYCWLGLSIFAAAVLLLWWRYQEKPVSMWQRTHQWLQQCTQVVNDPAATNLARLFRLLDIIGSVCGALTAATVMVLLPLYMTLSAYYGTFQQEYAWATSAAFSSGVTAAAIELVIWTLVVAVGVPAAFYYIGAAGSVATVSKGQPSKNCTAERSAPSTSQYWLRALSYASLNAAVVAGVNAAYVYIALYQSSEMLVVAQVLIAFFKLLWGQYGTDYMRRQIMTAGDDGGQFFVPVVIAVTNTLLIPCLVVVCVSPSCFYDLFVPPSSVSTIYNTPKCVVFRNGVCTQYRPELHTISYDPPYRYSYQCSSSFITYYAPAYVMMCMVSMFVVPAVGAVLLHFHQLEAQSKAVKWLVKMCLPYILYPPDEVPVDDSTRRLTALRLLVSLLTYVSVLLTFGVVFPPLAVALLAAILSTILFAKLQIGRFLYAAERWREQQMYVTVLDGECTAVPSVCQLGNVLWMLIAVSFWFYTLFLFDTLGDAVGFNNAYWVLIVMPLMPLLSYLALCNLRAPQGAKKTQLTAEEAVAVDVELAAVHNIAAHSVAAQDIGNATVNPLTTGDSNAENLSREL